MDVLKRISEIEGPDWLSRRQFSLRYRKQGERFLAGKSISLSDLAKVFDECRISLHACPRDQRRWPIHRRTYPVKPGLTIRNAIKREMKIQGVTPAELVRRLAGKVPTRTVYRFVNTGHNVNLTALGHILDALGISF